MPEKNLIRTCWLSSKKQKRFRVCPWIHQGDRYVRSAPVSPSGIDDISYRSVTTLEECQGTIKPPGLANITGDVSLSLVLRSSHHRPPIGNPNSWLSWDSSSGGKKDWEPKKQYLHIPPDGGTISLKKGHGDQHPENDPGNFTAHWPLVHRRWSGYRTLKGKSLLAGKKYLDKKMPMSGTCPPAPNCLFQRMVVVCGP